MSDGLIRRRKEWGALALLLAIASVLVFGGCIADGPKPNIILISVDCLNQRQFEEALKNGYAPTLQALAGRSLIFTRAYAHAPWTTPSHMSMLTGLYPSQHGRDISILMAGRFGELGERVADYETIADRLGVAGYETVAFVGKGSISAKFGLAQGFSVYHEFDQENPEKSDLARSIPALEHWLDQRKPGPFFLFFHTYDLHYPLPEGRPSDPAAIRYVDGLLARLIARLEEKGLHDSTLLLLTGDHGSSMIRTEGKCCLHGAGHYEENLRVPLLVKLPAPGKTGRSDVLVRHIDILPTVLDVAALRRGTYTGSGISLLARLDRPDDAVSFSEADARCVLRRAVVGRRHKYIYTSQDPVAQALHFTKFFFDPLCANVPACLQVPREELYDLDTDPFEERDLLKAGLTAETRVALDGLRAELERHLNLARSYHLAAATGDPGTPVPTVEVDDGVKEALRALGYVE
jgi:arylsulfatase A-like enzyme